MARKFIKTVLLLIIISTSLSILFGIIAFYYNSLKSPSMPYDLQGPAAIAGLVPVIFSLIIACMSVYFFIYVEDPIRKEALELKRISHKLSNTLQVMVADIANGRRHGREDIVMRGVKPAADSLREFILYTRAIQVFSANENDVDKKNEKILLHLDTCLMLDESIINNKTSLPAMPCIKKILEGLDIFYDVDNIVDLLEKSKRSTFQAENLDILIKHYESGTIHNSSSR